MSSIGNRVKGFVKLGHFLSQFSTSGIQKKTGVEHNDRFFETFKDTIQLAEQNNGWFTQKNILYALTQWATLLQQHTLEAWLSRYEQTSVTPKKVAIIMAGNIPLVGFHDFLSVLLTGHTAIIKPASNDPCLLPLIAKYLLHTTPDLNKAITFIDGKLEDFDAAIATGSNNTARYFDYYLGKRPNIIRKNRNSVAILTGKETTEQLTALGHDIFTYYGLGCRNVSKLFVPKDHNFKAFFEAIYPHHSIIEHTKYANNYDYNKAVYLMSLFNILENGFLMLKEDENYTSPIATVFYEYYDSSEALNTKLKVDKDRIQCIVADGLFDDEVAFGKTQQPQLWDYADGIDTVDFLLKI